MFNFLDDIPLSMLVFFSILMLLAPFVPEPHVVEKIKMLMAGTLTKPIDIFDLFYHFIPLILVFIKLYRMKNSI